MNGQPAKQLEAEWALDAHILRPVSFPNRGLAKGKSMVLIRALNKRLSEKKKKEHKRRFNDRDSFKSTWNHGTHLEEPDLVDATLDCT